MVDERPQLPPRWRSLGFLAAWARGHGLQLHQLGDGRFCLGEMGAAYNRIPWSGSWSAEEVANFLRGRDRDMC